MSESNLATLVYVFMLVEVYTLFLVGFIEKWKEEV